LLFSTPISEYCRLWIIHRELIYGLNVVTVVIHTKGWDYVCGTVAANSPLFNSQMTSEWTWSSSGMILARESKGLRGKPVQCHFVHLISHMDCPG
jgi:hypothetical protein